MDTLEEPAITLSAAEVINQALTDVCRSCLRPQATIEDWDLHATDQWTGGSDHLCWEEGFCTWSPTTTIGELAQLALTGAGLL